MEKKEALRQKQEAQLKLLSAKIDSLSAQAEKLQAEAKLEYFKLLETLKNKRDGLQKKMDEWEKAGDRAGRELQAGIKNSLSELKKAVGRALQKVK